VSDPGRPRGTVRLDVEDPSSVPIRDAATIMLLRDGDAGLEVFMLLRNLRSDFVGGAYVFPGGGVDPADGEPGSDESFRVAAIRESFEEAGLLLAREADGSLVSFAEPERARTFDAHRRAVDTGVADLRTVCAQEGLTLATDAMEHFSRWVTPLGAPRRYDTRFFVALAPPDQVGLHDDREVVANLWIRPADALARHADGDFELIFPTVRSLEELSTFATADEAMADAAGRGEIERIEPSMVVGDEDEVVIRIAEDVYDGVTGQRLGG
jgi:8-oxo-dGTP pyrophosphatase MutT (NUDIX family)